MEASLFTCPICYHDFDSADRVPKMIPSCGHTICSDCLIKIKNYPNINTHRCPFDAATLPQSIDFCPKNFSLLRIIEERAKVEKCNTHNDKQVKYLCLTDKKRICGLCYIEHQKKQHHVAPIEAIESQIAENIKQIHAFLEDVKTYHKSLILKAQENHQKQIECIKNEYNKLRAFIDEKEKEMIFESKCCLATSEFQLESVFGENSQMFRKFSRQKAGLESILTHENFFGENFYQEVKTEIQNYKLEIDLKNLMLQETEIEMKSNTFEKSMISVMEDLKRSLDNVKIPYLLDDFNEITRICSNKEIKEQNISSQEGDFLTFRAKSNLMIEHSGGVLTISNNEQNLDDILVDFQKWNGLHTIQLDLEDISKEDLQLLSLIWKRSVPSTLKVLPGQKTLSKNLCEALSLNILPESKFLKELFVDMSLAVLRNHPLGKLFKNVDFNNLETLSLNLGATNINDKDLLPLFVNMQNLKRFALYISDTQITDLTLGKCGQITFASSPYLEEITLYADRVKITDLGLESFLSNLKNLKKLALGLSETQITNKTVYSLSQTLSKSPMIEHFEVWLSDTKIVDLNFTEVFKALPKVKTFILSLDRTEIGDKTLEIFIRNTLLSMGNIKGLSLYLRETSKY